MTATGKILFEFKGTQSEVNTVQPLAGGRILLTEAGDRPRLLEVDRQGQVLVDVPLQAQTKDHHLQTRMARKLENGHYLVPQLLDKVVREYTPEGKVAWEAKTPDMPFTAIRLANGNTLVGCTVGNLVVELDPKGEIAWQVTNDDLPGRPISDACGVQRLPNGNTVIASYRAGGRRGQADGGDPRQEGRLDPPRPEAAGHPPLPDPRTRRQGPGRAPAPLRGRRGRCPRSFRCRPPGRPVDRVPQEPLEGGLGKSSAWPSEV